ncbi:MAG: hypothetical protein QF432_03510 [Dehalococcoidales bacterium]|nr:hypothetical protein [Dehalococcoidales bacterium]
MSNSLDIVPEDLAGKAEIIRGDVLELVKLLNDRGYMNLYVDGARLFRVSWKLTLSTR